jgi:hypothetical protein
VIKVKVVLTALGLAFALTACQTTGVGAPIVDSPVLVAEGYSLEKAVLAAATRRRWAMSKVSEDAYRLTIRQRGNLCSVDVVMDKESFSILPVESNIPVRKYTQWVDNLAREIRHRAARGK